MKIKKFVIGEHKQEDYKYNYKLKYVAKYINNYKIPTTLKPVIALLLYAWNRYVGIGIHISLTGSSI